MTAKARACSLTPAELGRRAEDWRALDAAQVVVNRRPGRLTVTYSGLPAIRGALLRLVEAEHLCCPDLRMSVEEDGSLARLVVESPPEARDVVDALFPPGSPAGGRLSGGSRSR